MAPLRYALDAEWLEPDGLGGFASGTVSGIRRGRYHALLLSASTPPTGRMVLVNGFEAWVEYAGRRMALSAQRYQPGVTYPDGDSRIKEFDPEPWPTWKYSLADGLEIQQEIFTPHGLPAVAVRWKVLGSLGPRRPLPVRLEVRPLLSGRDSHALHYENPVLRFDASTEGERVRWRPYDGVPPVLSIANAAYFHQPLWYRQALLDEERARGFEALEDVAAPGRLSWDLSQTPAVWLLAAEGLAGSDQLNQGSALQLYQRLHATERARRRRFSTRLHRTADAYLVGRGAGKTIVAGYPWFTDWGRDTFIALRGLCLASGRLDDARGILREWAGLVSQGMLPNRFIDQGDTPEFNSVDASLWYVIAVHEYLRAASPRGERAADDRTILTRAVQAILTGYADGTRFGIRADTDGLLLAGEPGVQLTWMDAKIGDWVVTPRIGKPVEIQALWLNALRIGAPGSDRWAELHRRGSAAFEARFWNPSRGCLYDVVDADGRAGAVDPSVRPNQILAIGGLPAALLTGERARRVVDAVEAQLWTPLGLRSLDPDEPAYVRRYEGGPRQRDAGYHQGTVWPWLIGPFVEAWVRVRGSTAPVRAEARERFLEPLMRHLDDAGLGHISEIADGDPPHTPRGCPFQAWSVGEVLRLQHLLADGPTPLAPQRQRSTPAR